MRKVKDVMTKNVVTIEPSARIVDAAKLLRERRIGCLVVSERKKPVGIITERDIVYRIIAEGRDINTAVKDMMTRDLRVIDKERDLEDATKIMNAHLIRRLPVVEEGELVGIITLNDIVSAQEEDTLMLS